MLFWTALALMTGAAMFAVLWPLGRAQRAVAAHAADLAVYRDQLAEIERDRARDLIAEREAEAARIEVSRRLLAADARADSGPSPGAAGRRRAAALMALIGVPLVAFTIYATGGSPGLPDAPLQARLDMPPERQDVAVLVRRIETHLGGNPDDARGWEVLAPIYLRLGRAQDAVAAYANVLRLRGPSAGREADFGEALVAAADGTVEGEARAAFQRALALDAKNAKARFFMALALEQDGRNAEALDAWRTLAAESAEGDRALEAWRLAAARRAAALEAKR